MKKLSIKEKAIAYDEAIEKLRNAFYDNNSRMCEEYRNAVLKIIEPIFPELAESEDERIRKEIIAFLTYYHTGQGNSLKYDDGWIAWLEKQGKKIKPIEGFNTEFERQISHIIASTINKEYEYTEDSVKWVSNALLNYAKHEFEKQGEQKPADKIEPKFKVGDWIVCKNGGESVYRVSELTTTGYKITNLEERYYYVTFEQLVNCNATLWTIQDAKDGDVLAYNDSKNNVWVCIFKKYTNERVYDYCTLDKESFWEHGNWNYLASFSYTPATKEQRNQLERAMTNAGYKWNKEELKLEKI